MNQTLVLNLPATIKSSNLRLKLFWMINIALVIILLGFCVFQINMQIKESSLIKNYENKIVQISEQNKNLEINFSQANSLANLETLLMNLNYEKVGRVQYLRVPGSTVVAK